MGVELSEFIDKHQIHPPIAKVFKFEEAVEAIDALRNFSGVGKVVIEV
jgi:NADPH:quinone reductase-like Zn-dependent oxidoreductase